MEGLAECARCKRFFERSKVIDYQDGYFICSEFCAPYFYKELFANYKVAPEENIRADPMRPYFSDTLVQCQKCGQQVRKRHVYVASGVDLAYICSNDRNHEEVRPIQEGIFTDARRRTYLSIISSNMATCGEKDIEKFVVSHGAQHLLDLFKDWDLKGRPTTVPEDFEDEVNRRVHLMKYWKENLSDFQEARSLTDKQLQDLVAHLRRKADTEDDFEKKYPGVMKDLQEYLELTDSQFSDFQSRLLSRNSNTRRPPSEECTEYIGLTLEEAEKKAIEGDYTTRVVSRDGESFIITDDLRYHRLNFTVVDGKVTHCKNY